MFFRKMIAPCAEPPAAAGPAASAPSEPPPNAVVLLVAEMPIMMSRCSNSGSAYSGCPASTQISASITHASMYLHRHKYASVCQHVCLHTNKGRNYPWLQL